VLSFGRRGKAWGEKVCGSLVAGTPEEAYTSIIEIFNRIDEKSYDTIRRKAG